MWWIIGGILVVALICGRWENDPAVNARRTRQAVEKLAKLAESGSNPYAKTESILVPKINKSTKATRVVLGFVLAMVGLAVLGTIGKNDDSAKTPNAIAGEPLVKRPAAPTQSLPSHITGKVDRAKNNVAVAQVPAQKSYDGALEASDHCAMTYIGATDAQAFEHASLAVRGQVVDCIGYYAEHNRYPTGGELKTFTAAQERDYQRHLSPQERRRRTEEAIGEVICQGNQTCVERGVEANQAIDKLEDQLNADERN